MTLPDWSTDGVLPAGLHATTMDGLYERLVLDSPYRDQREVSFGAIQTHLAVVKEIIPSGSAWIDGTLLMRDSSDIESVNVALHPADWDALVSVPEEKQRALVSAISLADVIVGDPGPIYFEQVRSIGGRLDSYIAHPASKDAWFQAFSQIHSDDLDVSQKGIVEVSW